VPRVQATLDHARAALAAARGAGFAVERAQVARVASNVLVRLEPGAVAARLTGATEGFRDGAANLCREARLAAALAAVGAPVLAPLGGLDPAGLGLEPLAMLTEARRLARGALPEIVAALDRALATLAAAPQRIVHGDSHPGNVLWTADGPLWSDWEDAHLAPLEWDLGCLVAAARMRGNDFGWAEAALAAHGGPFDATLLEVCVDARVAQGAAYLAATRRGEVSGHLAWLGLRGSSV
jgi:Ser/Thr protein kinase RdoA (MazF antagonist)